MLKSDFSHTNVDVTHHHSVYGCNNRSRHRRNNFKTVEKWELASVVEVLSRKNDRILAKK